MKGFVYFRKAAEYVRLLQTKSMSGSNMTDTSKLVVCLDLASELYNVDLKLVSDLYLVYTIGRLPNVV